jgi:hypothetical protein
MVNRIIRVGTPLEYITIYTLLGIRFWDPAREAEVTDGLWVTARPKGVKTPVVSAFRTAAGIYAFQGLPGLRDDEYPTEADSPPGGSGERKPFTIEVWDRLGRFLPLAFAVELPSPDSGVYPTASEKSPPEDKPPGVCLFSAPTRSAIPGLATVRAQLCDLDNERPAAYAKLEVEIGKKKHYGISDERGGSVILFPYPRLINLSTGSPPNGRIPLHKQTWDITVRVYYDAMDVPAVRPGQVPLLSQIIGQNQNNIRVEGETAVKQLPAKLTYGQELVLHTNGKSELFVNASSSP